jgi:hypothetical protein
MPDLTHIVDGERVWKEDRASFLINKDTSLHSLIINGLVEATKQPPATVQDYLVFVLEPIVIEVHKEIQIVTLVSEKVPRKDFGYSRWKYLFSIIRTYWLAASEALT